MNRLSWILTISAALAIAGYFTDFDDAEENTSAVADNSQLLASIDVAVHEDDGAVFQSHELIDHTSAVRTDPPAADAITRWTSVANSDDQQERSAAIDALASAPKAQALPLLQKLIVSDTADDRESALNVLRTIARSQGDVDGEIQNIIRLTIYDGDDSIVASAQSVLGDIESDGERSAIATP